MAQFIELRQFNPKSGAVQIRQGQTQKVTKDLSAEDGINAGSRVQLQILTQPDRAAGEEQEHDQGDTESDQRTCPITTLFIRFSFDVIVSDGFIFGQPRQFCGVCHGGKKRVGIPTRFFMRIHCWPEGAKFPIAATSNH